MAAKKWQNGQKVIATHDWDIIKKGMTGTIVRDFDQHWLGVDWNAQIDGHDCGGHARIGHGYNCPPEMLQLDVPPDPASPIPEELDTLYGKEQHG